MPYFINHADIIYSSNHKARRIEAKIYIMMDTQSYATFRVSTLKTTIKM